MVKSIKRDNGIELLRVGLAFLVVVCHFWNYQVTSCFDEILKHCSSLAVPLFMLISFSFTKLYEREVYSSIKRIMKRMWKLMFPHIVFSIVYYCWYKIFFFIYKQNDVTLCDVFWQIVSGNTLNPAAWFQVDLVILTFLIWLFFYIMNIIKCNYECLVLALLVGTFLVIQYLGVSYTIINALMEKSDVFYWTLGRIVEMFPYAGIGCLIQRKNIIYRLKNDRKGNSFLLLTILVLFELLMSFYNNYFEIKYDFGYGGIRRIIEAVLIMLFIVSLNVDFGYLKMEKIISMSSSSTVIVYFIHNLVGAFLIASNDTIQRGSLKLCLLVFCVSMFIGIGYYKLKEFWGIIRIYLAEND